MLGSYWFASVLIGSDGRWRGRFLRTAPAAGSAAEALPPLLEERSDKGDDDLLFVPAAAAAAAPGLSLWGSAGEPCSCAWDDPAATTPWVAMTAAAPAAAAPTAASRIVLDTASVAAWQFDRTTTLADIGHLQQRRPPAQDGERSRPQLVNLLILVMRDADTRELEQAFRADPELAYHLLRLVNSVGMSLTQPVKSLAHAITVLGRRQLQRWVQLLMYVDTAADAARPNPLLQLAAYRGALLEALIADAGDADSAYIVGMLSLLDRVLPKTIQEIVAELPIRADVRAALATHDGPLGALLAAGEAAEAGQLDDAAARLSRLGVAPLRWSQAQSVAYRWAHALGTAAATA